MNKNGRIFVILGVVVVILIVMIAFPLIVMRMIKQVTDQALSPFEQANQQLKTQVSDLLNPTPTIIPDPITIIRDVRALARLETIQYSVEKVITAEMGQGNFSFLFGDRLLFVAHGTVIAGIDMAKINPEDMWLEGEVLNVRLPQPEVFVATIDNEKSYVYDRETGLLTQPDQNLETKARQAAENEIRKAALEDGIIDLAKVNAESFLTRFYRALGYDTVVFLYPTPEP